MSYVNKISNSHFKGLLQGNILDVARGFGLDVEHINQDGVLHRVKTFTQPKKRNGWYICDPLGGFLVIGDWQSGLKKVWSLNECKEKYQHQLSIDKEALKHKKAKEKQEIKKKRDQQISAENSAKLYYSSNKVLSHPYLKAKQINGIDGLRVNRGSLLVPMFDISEIGSNVINVQSIHSNGTKRFMKGGRVQGACFPIGKQKKGINTVYIAEGFATAATVHLITHDLVLAAMNAGNLKAVALSARKRWPRAKIIIAGDDDWNTQMKTRINVGIDKAKEAAISVGGFTCFPPFTDEQRKAKLTDWNDYLLANSGGIIQWKI